MGTISSETGPMSNLQREMLRLFAQDVPEKDLNAIRQLISQYFAEKAMDLADHSWDGKGWTKEDAIRLVNTKMRTPYHSKKE